ncbi:hypothetical protein Nepgr_007726 [Nepenthes gracilis]|uniref:Uncharacterized protein n=1 Tax=Nepenthes gracilis TaxID=150966 RepID=A0AAD3S8D7_NEPGR|nr:hypothetical protein Nepgr_007726 [Nepenthes gracilis]
MLHLPPFVVVSETDLQKLYASFDSFAKTLCIMLNLRRNSSAEGFPNPEGTSFIHSLCNFFTGKLEKRKIQHLAKILISFIVRIIGSITAVPSEFWPMRSNINSSDLVDSVENHIPTAEVDSRDDHIFPCLQHLQRIEALYEELSNRPAAIPPEKERMLQESLDRIKCVECDLDKTKRVLHTTVLKQLEISEVLENLDQSKCHRRRLFCS